jgi:phosphoglycerol transferase MdoB-like AlkP superfamily enzyme
MIKKLCFTYIKLLILWILIFDFQRILFSIHHWNKFESISILEWFGVFYHSFRLDLSTASALSIVPFIFLMFYYFLSKEFFKKIFIILISIEIIIVAIIHCGEINAYSEWNHKLTSRVFMHLSNPDEVVRSADASMTFWFFIYLIIEIVFSWKLMKYFFNIQPLIFQIKRWKIAPYLLIYLVLFSSFSVVFLRGGFQAIPININAAIYSKNAVSNDLSINSLYYFLKSFLLYNRSNIDDLIPKIEFDRAEKIVAKLYDYNKNHEEFVLKTSRPNIVLVVLESWVADAVGSLGSIKNATPKFDQLAKDGILFTNVYSTSHTSEIGNASIFSGFPAIPEVSISMQPEKSRKLNSINQSLKPFGYKSSYLFGGDLKYGNIGGFFLDHKFDVVKDENDFPKSIKRGKLNYFDQDLFQQFLKEINQSKEPFLQCAFTGSTHSPYDFPRPKKQKFKGIEADFMNSIVYSDLCIGAFIEKAKKQKWFDNTLFIFIADHGHATPNVEFAMVHEFYRIPLLFWGAVIKEKYRGKKIDKIGSQSDLPSTLLYQMKINTTNYNWSKDLLNPNVPEFAFHTVIGGFGWGNKNGHLIYQMQINQYLNNTFEKNLSQKEKQNANAFLKCVYEYYKGL